ncbi:hypothetical protein BDD12DRAFT_909612 [Trichophaea hybrida]|nr:hypothetical protein BDD12DRAFT_909612 [Trichophaea hybrida]
MMNHTSLTASTVLGPRPPVPSEPSETPCERKRRPNAQRRKTTNSAIFGTLIRITREILNGGTLVVTHLNTNYTKKGEAYRFCYNGDVTKPPLKTTVADWKSATVQQKKQFTAQGAAGVYFNQVSAAGKLVEGVAALQKIIERLTVERGTANDKVLKLPENASAVEKAAHSEAVKSWNGTAWSTILLGMEPRLQPASMDIEGEDEAAANNAHANDGDADYDVEHPHTTRLQFEGSIVVVKAKKVNVFKAGRASRRPAPIEDEHDVDIVSEDGVWASLRLTETIRFLYSPPV